ncbi:MAG TPA: hypothetical protein VFV66_00545 [Nonomuraea sp.]|nr:hypothetical protein [Nonomuraea sp.]
MNEPPSGSVLTGPGLSTGSGLTGDQARRAFPAAARRAPAARRR